MVKIGEPNLMKVIKEKSMGVFLDDGGEGIGNWTEDQFIYCMRHGKYMGLPKGRDLLPPMPWPAFSKMTDDELKAVFAYLQTTKPVHNIVPQPLPPVLSMKK